MKGIVIYGMGLVKPYAATAFDSFAPLRLNRGNRDGVDNVGDGAAS